MSLADMIFAGVFERYPHLKVGTVEQELSWIPHFLDRLDYTYTQRARRDYWHRFQGEMLPSDFFHQNVFCSFQEDVMGIRDRAIIGVENLMWGSDYPHQESTWPKSRRFWTTFWRTCQTDEKVLIAGENVARLYQFKRYRGRTLTEWETTTSWLLPPVVVPCEAVEAPGGLARAPRVACPAARSVNDG